MKKNSVLLDVDSSLMDKNLRIIKDDGDVDVLQSLLNNLDDERDSKTIHPRPGFCIKTWKDSKEKLFVNVCHSEHLPPPKDISDEELVRYVNSKVDEFCGVDGKGITKPDFCVPMSLGEAHTECDKAGRPCDVYDVAVNSQFFDKCEKNNLFKSFLVNLAVCGVAEKYSVEMLSGKDPIVLKNCKCMGKILVLRIQNRKPANESSFDKLTGNVKIDKKPLIEEMNSNNGSVLPKMMSTTASLQPYQILIDSESAQAKNVTPKSLTVIVLIEVERVKRGKELLLDVGEDRLLLRESPDVSSAAGQNRNDKILLDVFLPYNVIQEGSTASFNTNNKVLTVTLPVAG